jgi:hypothetical protein
MNPTRLLLIMVLLAVPLEAQEGPPGDTGDEELHQIRLGDGSRFVGRVLERAEGRVVFESITGVRLEVQEAFVRIQPARGRLVNGEFWPEDRNSTRLFFAPTGRTLPQGEGYAGLFVILPFVAVGATDHLTLAGGIPPAGSLQQSPVWVAPKLRLHTAPGIELSAGLFGVYLPGVEEWDHTGRATRGSPEMFAIAYAVGTYGDPDRALHAGAGISFGNAVEGGRVPLMLGGELRVSRRNKLITENWFVPGGGGMLTGGVRLMGEGRWNTDLGLAALPGDPDLPYFPIVSFSYSFGGRR